MPGPALNVKDQAVVAGGTSGSNLVDRSKILAGCRIRQGEHAARVLVCRGRTCTGCCESVLSGATVSRNVHSRIERALNPHMDRVVSEVGPGHQPVRAELLLQSQIPLIKLHGL